MYCCPAMFYICRGRPALNGVTGLTTNLAHTYLTLAPQTLQHMNWHYRSFDLLSVSELYSILQLRSKVFVVEQNCPYLDMDDKDQQSIHLWLADDQGRALAYCRLLPAGVSYPQCSIGRVVTDPGVRGSGSGRVLMQKAISYIEAQWQETSIRIGAQLYLKTFYESLGFVQSSEPYLEDNIPHIEMIRQQH